MDLGNRLLNLRKKEGLSQEEVADKLGVSRQTISKWETNQSLPDFDKIAPLCEMFDISTDELLKGEQASEKTAPQTSTTTNTIKKRAQYIGMGTFLYFLAIAWFMVTVPAFDMNPMLSIAIFLIICGIGTYMIVYASIVYKVERNVRARKKSRLLRTIISIVTLMMTCIYLLVSFATFAWHITWILWIINAVLIAIIKLIFILKGEDDEEQ